jgi:hypothetical protein
MQIEPKTDDPLYTSAHKRAEELQGFYIHLLVISP